MDYTQSIGNVVELQCISKFIEMGFQCSIPYGNSAKYDFIAELPNGELIKVQCKSSVWERKNIEEKSAFTFPCQTSTTNSQGTIRHSYNSQQVDYFATYIEGQVYLVPIEECSTSKTLRLLPPRNGNKNYSKAEDYTIEKVLGYLQDKDFIFNLEEHNKQITSCKDPEEQKLYQCKKCGKLVWNKESLCRDCYKLQQRIVERPSREELKMLIRNKSFTSIGKIFGVSDNAVRKWCDTYNLPRKSSLIKNYSDEEWNNL